MFADIACDADKSRLERLNLSDLATFVALLNEKRGAAIHQMGAQLLSSVFPLLENQGFSQSHVLEELEPQQLETSTLDSTELITAFDFKLKPIDSASLLILVQPPLG